MPPWPWSWPTSSWPRPKPAQIAGQVGRPAALGAIALVLVLFAISLVVIGTSLFVGEWLLGSIGWGVLHGFLLFVSVAMAAVLLAVGVSERRILRSLIIAIVIGIVSGVVLGLALLNQLYAAIGEAAQTAVDPGDPTAGHRRAARRLHRARSSASSPRCG